MVGNAMIGAKVLGASRLVQLLKSMPKDLQIPITQAQIANAMDVHGTAIAMISSGTRSGRTYKSGGRTRPRKVHVASAPGEPPKSDEGNLVERILWKADFRTLSAEIGTNEPYGRYLEIGAVNRTSGARQLVGRAALAHVSGILYPRPWLVPSFEKNRNRVVKRLSKAVKIALQHYKKKTPDTK